MDKREIIGIVESILYIAEDPITIEDLSNSLNVDKDILITVFKKLGEKYGGDSGILLKKVAGGYFFKSNPKYQPYLKDFVKNLPHMKLSMAALETLAIIAYKQPITIPEILRIRGVKSTGAIKTLIEKKLIVPKGRKKVLGRPMMYGTSSEFLKHFGLNSLEDLPEEEEIKDLLNLKFEGEEKVEVKNSENNS